MRALWPVLAVAGGSFALAQFVSSNYLDYSLTDVLAALDLAARHLGVSADLVAATRCAVCDRDGPPRARPRGPSLGEHVPPGRAGFPGSSSRVVVILWTHLKIAAIGQQTIHWPGLHNAVFITLYHKAYAANWAFQPLGTGTAILVAAIITAALRRRGTGAIRRGDRRDLAAEPFGHPHGRADRRSRLSHELLGNELHARVSASHRPGIFFPMLSAFLGWVAVFLSGSDTSGNALFGNLQVVAANQLGLNPVLIAATNSSGGVMGKMISPQNIATGVSVTALEGPGGSVCSRARSNTASS